VGLLYRIDQAQIIGYEARQGCTTLVDGLEPDCNGDVENPQCDVTCDSNSDGIPDGNRLFSRPPLIVHTWVCRSGCPDTSREKSILQGPFKIWIIVNHFKSKVEDSSSVQYTLPRRIQQANFVAGLVHEILEADPGASIIVLGDLNDQPNSQPLVSLAAQGMQDLSPRIEKSRRYTYIFEGVSQVLDYVLVSLQPSLSPGIVNPLNINADYPYEYMSIEDSYHRSSDHDLLLVDFFAMDYLTYLPLVSR
jgi:Endonuclease/Exonuclease/phosphatase family